MELDCKSSSTNYSSILNSTYFFIFLSNDVFSRVVAC